MGILGWGFRATIKVHQAGDDKPLTLKTKKNQTLTYREFIKTGLPIVNPSQKLWLNPLLFNGTLQTLYYTSNGSKKFLIYYGRELFTYKDGGICSLDWTIPTPNSKEEFKQLHDEAFPEGFPRLHPRTRYFTKSELETRQAANQEVSEPVKPIVVILHGLAGGSHETLIRNFAQTINQNTDGWDTVIINSRGCCRTKITTEKLFTALSTNDIKEVLLEIKRRYPTRPIYAVGFSFGSILLANFLGEQEKEEGHDELIKAACLIGCAWDLVDSGYHLASSWSGAYLFNPALTDFLTKIVKNNFTELKNHDPELFSQELLDKVRKIKNVWEFDNLITCKTVGLPNVTQYYRKASPVNRINNIRTPTLIINSTDDPAVGVRLPILDVLDNPYLSMIESDLGGHLGFVKSSGEFWCVDVAEQFFQNFEASF